MLARSFGCLAALTVVLAQAALGLAQQESASEGRKFALLIGVARYASPELDPLPHVETDLAELALALEKSGYPEENIILMTPQKSLENPRFSPFSRSINDEFLRLASLLKPEDSLLLVYSGHSVGLEGEKSDSFLCPADARFDQRNTLISLSRLYDAFDRLCKCRSKILLADVSHSTARNQEADQAIEPQELTPPESVAALFSCSAGQKAHLHEDLPQSVFFHYVIEALGGAADFNADGAVSARELDLYVSPHVQTFVRTQLNERQLPERLGANRGEALVAKLPPGAQQPSLGELASARGVSPRPAAPSDNELANNTPGPTQPSVPSRPAESPGTDATASAAGSAAYSDLDETDAPASGLAATGPAPLPPIASSSPSSDPPEPFAEPATLSGSSLTEAKPRPPVPPLSVADSKETAETGTGPAPNPLAESLGAADAYGDQPATGPAPTPAG